MPGSRDPDYAAVDVLADVLGSERGALYELVPQGKALDVEFSLELQPEAGIGYVAAAFPAGGDAKALEAEVRATLARIAKEGVPADLVAAAKLQERRQAEFAKNSIEGLATVWSEAVAVYGLELAGGGFGARRKGDGRRTSTRWPLNISISTMPWSRC